MMSNTLVARIDADNLGSNCTIVSSEGEVFLRALSVRERLYEALRDEIMYGHLSPGERVTEKELSEKFQASRGTIRECLRQLETEGLLTFENHKGYRVSKLSTREVDEIYSLRMLLESYATRLTAEKMTPTHISYLEKAQNGCIKAAEKLDFSGWLKYNTDFHHFFYEHCGNENLRILLDILKRRIYRYQYIIISIPGHFDEYLTSHKKVIEACRKKDGDAAEKFMREHLDGIKKILLNRLKDFPALK